jgi:hypothetical protein
MDSTAPGLAEETIGPDEPSLTADFIRFLKDVSARRHPSGVIRRFNQGRAAGCVEAVFTVRANLPVELRVGVFSTAASYPAWIRFANASSTTDREKDIRGMSIKVTGVEGDNLTEGTAVQDFVLNSHPVMPAAGTRDFLALLRAMEAGGVRRAMYFLTHPRSARVGLAARQHPTSHLDIPYWSATPYLFGQGRAVKYVVQPTSRRRSALPEPLTDRYLRDALAAHLAREEATFEFLVQLQINGRTMPIEDALTEWKEEESPYQAVADIRIPIQDVDLAGRSARCEEVAFNPWHCLREHRPLGSMNRARREIYQAMAEFRKAGA